MTTFTQATEKLMWYARRWGIEVLHRTLKSGCRIEQRQLGNAERIEACLAIDMVVAWRISPEQTWQGSAIVAVHGVFRRNRMESIDGIHQHEPDSY
jgi:hypothetical protein